ncbi:hypothetical protein N0V93_006317 [Gnomoniopsis smithogilvyi]|uniref:DUF7703 domain-containing protein n=1 Tax=Gnomoniopsis smithogilvyi TaxID=1191159 RepID=A0A9W8YQJ9_9PEZI|nr:hypothetical protein N0V93_006317 [Gnomoniopsis smithogilvyi]
MAFYARGEGNGLTSADAVTGPTLFIVTSFIALAFYNVLELSLFIYTTFKRRKGLYFWSMVIATWGIALNGSGYLVKFIRPDESLAVRAFSTSLVLVGWCAMITGHSVVLFSRLHLLVSDPFKIRLVLTMIMVDALICHPPTLALFALVQSDNPQPYVAAYSVYEKFQLLVFFIQEVIISIIYIMESARFLRARASINRMPIIDMKAMHVDGRTVMRWLIAVNVLVVFLDLSILGFEFSGFYDLQTSWKCLVYSIKLKLEFGILNKLIAVVKARNPDLFNSDGIQLGVISDNKMPTMQSIHNAPNAETERDTILPIQSPVEESFKATEPLKRTKDQNSSRLPVVSWRPERPPQSDVNTST